ncbi:DUF6011 domain-containing protein [Streptomyces sp. NPDC055642]
MSRERRKCEGGCGRWLSDPVSIARGYGRQCAERLGIPVVSPARRLAATVRRPPAVRTDPPVEIHPDQTALDLTDHQPSLWSL